MYISWWYELCLSQRELLDQKVGVGIKASELFVECLEREGVSLIFGVPGEENADLMMALNKSNSIRFVLTRHEQGAAFMAEVYGRLTGNCLLYTSDAADE